MAMRKVTTRTNARKATKAKPRGRTATKATQKAKQRPKAKAKPQTRAKKNADDEIIIRRPSINPPPSPTLINNISSDILEIMEQLDNFTADLRALDRQRHNGVGLKRLGFIEAAFRISSKFPQYFPHWLNTAKFKADLDLFNAIRSLVEVCRSLEEKAWNINVISADMIYTDALEYYAQVQDAANRRIDSAESLFIELHSFFKSHGRKNEDGETPPTKKQVKRDFNALDRGTKDGKIVIENVRPKMTGGKHEVIDETFKDTTRFKGTVDGEIEE